MENLVNEVAKAVAYYKNRGIGMEAEDYTLSNFIKDCEDENVLFKKSYEDKNLIQYSFENQLQRTLIAMIDKFPKLINMTDSEGRSMIHKAVLYDCEEVFFHAYEIDNSSVIKKDNYKKSPFYYFSEKYNDDYIKSHKILD